MESNIKLDFNKIKICIVIGIHNYDKSINRVIQIKKTILFYSF